MPKKLLLSAIASAFLLLTPPAAAQDTSSDQGVFRLDYTLERTGPEGKVERSFSLLMTCNQGAEIRESSRKRLGQDNQWADVGVNLSARTHDAADGRLTLASNLRITEVETDSDVPAPQFTVTGSTTATVQMDKRVSLINIESQDGLRRYELLLRAKRVDD